MNKDIVFEKETITQDIPADKPHTYWFNGYNLSDKIITRLTFESSCSCTVSNPPKLMNPKERFQFEIIFDPQGNSGYYAKSVKFKLDNGQEIRLRINGKIIEQEKQENK